MAQDNFNDQSTHGQFPPLPADLEADEVDVRDLLLDAPVGMPDQALDQGILDFAGSTPGSAAPNSLAGKTENVVPLYGHQENTSFSKVLFRTLAAAAVVVMAIVVVPMMSSNNPLKVPTQTADTLASSDNMEQSGSDEQPNVDQTSSAENASSVERVDNLVDSDSAGVSDSAVSLQARPASPEQEEAGELAEAPKVLPGTDSEVKQELAAPSEQLSGASSTNAVGDAVEDSDATGIVLNGVGTGAVSTPNVSSSKMVVENVTTPAGTLSGAAPVDAIQQTAENRDSALDRTLETAEKAQSNRQSNPQTDLEKATAELSEADKRLEFLRSRAATSDSTQTLSGADTQATDTASSDLKRAAREFNNAVLPNKQDAIAETGSVAESIESGSRKSVSGGVARTTIISTGASAQPEVVKSINMTASANSSEETVEETTEDALATETADAETVTEPAYRRSLHRWKSEILKLSRQGETERVRKEYELFKKRHPNHTIDIKSLRKSDDTGGSVESGEDESTGQ